MDVLSLAREALAAIRQDGESPAASPEASDDFERVLDMRLDAFAEAGLILGVYSEVLDREVLFVSDNVADEALPNDDRVVYRAHELRKLWVLRPQPAQLRTLHATKAVFGGTIREVVPDTDRAVVAGS